MIYFKYIAHRMGVCDELVKFTENRFLCYYITKMMDKLSRLYQIRGSSVMCCKE